MGLLETAVKYRQKQTELRDAFRNPGRRQTLAIELRTISIEADKDAENLREWLENAENMDSPYYRSATQLYEAYMGARRLYWDWKDSPSPESFRRMQNAERVLSEVCLDVSRKKKLLQSALMSATNQD